MITFKKTYNVKKTLQSLPSISTVHAVPEAFTLVHATPKQILTKTKKTSKQVKTPTWFLADSPKVPPLQRRKIVVVDSRSRGVVRVGQVIGSCSCHIVYEILTRQKFIDKLLINFPCQE